ncbi:anti-sigma factor [Erythrobacter litoralis]|uniref:Anti-sigma K factor RskA C-terminal domain-containing protein n=1 Tax=Erythrobacter litoralis (strain HTCC2594) TaxID=314225 RepID=Q2NDB8_ERYLH|nr:anti-sigma factor [Erythrobacter litoralis]ABC62323.1 hypothetical protein ELI_01155 [Erythrobacter litoralis HTCC2594]
MTDTDTLAAEYALGLLEGEDLLRARGMQANDPVFAEAVEKWETHLGPLLDDVPSAEPRPDLWHAIEARLNADTDTGDTVISLERQVVRWKWLAGLSSVAAAVLLALTFLPVGTQPGPPPVETTTLASSIPVGESGLRLEVTYLGGERELLVSAAGLSADGVHDHELWVVPAEGSAQSLGVVAPGEIRRTSLDEGLAAQLVDGADLVLTREPLGGAPADGEVGPIVARGEFTAL